MVLLLVLQAGRVHAFEERITSERERARGEVRLYLIKDKVP